MGVIICEGSKYILKVSSLLYLYKPYFCKTVKLVEGGGVVKSGSFKLTSSWLKPSWLKPTWFKAHGSL